jgi:hypothetical protein
VAGQTYITIFIGGDGTIKITKYSTNRDLIKCDSAEVHLYPKLSSKLSLLKTITFIMLKILFCNIVIKQKTETRNVSEISSSHGGEYDVQSCLLGCTAM